MTSFNLRPIVFWLLLAVGLYIFINAIQAVLLPFIVGALVAYCLDPLADRLERLGASRTLATLIITLGFFGLLTLGLIWLIPTLIHQINDVILTLPSVIEQLRSWIGSNIAHYTSLLSQEQLTKATEVISQSGEKVANALSPLAAGLLNSGKMLLSMVSMLVISPIVSFYLLRDWDVIVAKLDDLLPRQHADTIREQMALIDTTISGYMRGTFNVMLMLALFYAVSLSLIGLNFAILIALIGGVAILIPYLGTIISGGAAVGMAYLQFDSLEPVAITFAIFVVGQILEGNVLTPKMVGDKVGLHPLWLIFGMLAGGALFGFVGILLAIPATAIVGVLSRFAVLRYKQSAFYAPTNSSPPSNV